MSWSATLALEQKGRRNTGSLHFAHESGNLLSPSVNTWRLPAGYHRPLTSRSPFRGSALHGQVTPPGSVGVRGVTRLRCLLIGRRAFGSGCTPPLEFRHDAPRTCTACCPTRPAVAHHRRPSLPLRGGHSLAVPGTLPFAPCHRLRPYRARSLSDRLRAIAHTQRIEERPTSCCTQGRSAGAVLTPAIFAA